MTKEVTAKRLRRQEFEAFSQKIRPKLLAIAGSFSFKSGIEAEDVVQETLIRVWELVEQGYPIRNNEGMAVRIAKNICISHSRRAQPETQPLTHDNYCGDSESTELTDIEDLRKIKQSIYGALSETQREYLHLRNDKEMTLDEIANVTGKPKTSIKSSISAARRQMLELIKKHL